MFGAQCYLDAEVWESHGLARASLETMLGAWCLRKPLTTDMGPTAAGLAATIGTNTTKVGEPQAAVGAQISSNHRSSLIFVSGRGGGHTLVSWQNPQNQTGLKRILGIGNHSSPQLGMWLQT